LKRASPARKTFRSVALVILVALALMGALGLHLSHRAFIESVVRGDRAALNEEYAQAEQIYRGVPALFSNSKIVNERLSDVYLRQGRWQEAQACAGEALRKAPGDPESAARKERIERVLAWMRQDNPLERIFSAVTRPTGERRRSPFLSFPVEHAEQFEKERILFASFFCGDWEGLARMYRNDRHATAPVEAFIRAGLGEAFFFAL
jgi:tetratricopeptide (TPR) repeat protein